MSLLVGYLVRLGKVPILAVSLGEARMDTPPPAFTPSLSLSIYYYYYCYMDARLSMLQLLTDSCAS